jgi:hypothetical protein
MNRDSISTFLIRYVIILFFSVRIHPIVTHFKWVANLSIKVRRDLCRLLFYVVAPC